MTTTHQDNGHEDQEDDMIQDDITSHLSHPGIENPENPNEFHNFPWKLKDEICKHFCHFFFVKFPVDVFPGN